MSFTFDDLGKPKSESDSFKLNKLSARIAELKSNLNINSADAEKLNSQIIALEQQRQKLSNRGAKPVKLADRAVDDNWDKNSGPPLPGAPPLDAPRRQRPIAGFRVMGRQVFKPRT
jgi:hypothetical protein